MRAWRAIAVLCLAWVLVVPGASLAEVKLKAWSDFDTQDLGTSLLFDVGQPGSWSVGPLFSWADNRDLDSDDQWSIGLQWEMQVDPNATVAISDWLGAIGDAVGLPPTLTARTYVVGESKLVRPFESEENDLTTVFAIGPGIGVGPLCLEYVYQLVDGGNIPTLDLESGAVLRFGALWEF